MLAGGTLNLATGTGRVAEHPFDLTNMPNNADLSTTISSNLVVGGGAGNLAFSPQISTTSSSTYYATYLYLSGSNNFANAVVGGEPPSAGRNHSGLAFTSTQSLNYNGQVPNFTLGNNSELDWMGPSPLSTTADTISSGTMGTITLNPTVGLNGTSGSGIDQQTGSYTRNTGQNAYGDNG